MRVLTVGQMRAADQAAGAEAGLPGALLMARAGAAVARTVASLAALRGARTVVVVAGHGNNGGDACVAARCLFEDGFHVHVIMTCVPAALKGDAREAWDAMRTGGVPYVVLASEQAWDEDEAVASGALVRQGVVVDGVLGTGCRGVPTGAAARAIRWINARRSHALVVAIDLPSGMEGDSGAVAGDAVRADVTVSFGRPKRCFLNAEQAGRVGHLVVADIGIPEEVCDRGAAAEPCEVIGLPELARWFPPRAWAAHKGDFGHVGVIGGSAGLCHAPVLAALGAVRSGAGRVTVALPEAGLAAAAAQVPEAMAHALAAPGGSLDAASLRGWSRAWEAFDVLVAGPGLGRAEGAREGVGYLLALPGVRLVLDADGLSALAALKADGWRPAGDGRLVLTPHPGEAARLLGATAGEVQADRLGAVRRLADTYGAVVVLKGAGTLVCEPGGVPWLNLTGNPGLASGGTGDVLAGMLGALWARGLAPARAAALAVWAHGTAADWEAFEGSQTGVCATAVARRLGRVFQEVERAAEERVAKRAP